MTRLAIVQKEYCNPLKCDYLCIKLCPINRGGAECIKKTEKVAVDESLCNGCGICSNRCQFKAIHIINLPQQLEKHIHRFQPNGFALYHLPTPQKGKVVGILGKNGIGKTTAVKILAGLIKPNLGKDASYEEVIKFFKGSELQKYFEKLKNNEIKVSYKPQRVDEIPKQVKGRVKDLLKKVDEKNGLNNIVKELEIENILNHNVENLSGGELQLVAVAASVLKKADIIIFDEPSSYLDIKQRLKLANFIKSLANTNTSIIVIEHDLIILDYMTDLIHFMYGKESCYGIVSQPKASKSGINTYLEGYAKEENIRFRDKSIKFLLKVHEKLKKEITLAEWPSFSKKLDSFLLEVNQSKINKEEVIGIIGRNAIGKTTFAKILSGLLKPDKNELNLNLKISYKPQYLESSNELVSVVLRNALSKYNNELIQPLELEKLLLRKLNELSGGELQRVAIALCLSQDADLILMDEPSAFLDVEQRLALSKIISNIIIQKNISALIIDHDLLFIDYLSDKLMVFDGIPAKHGIVKGVFSMEEGMNKLLKELNITLRHDQETNRPRINKIDSVKDREQKNSNKYYYT